MNHTRDALTRQRPVLMLALVMGLIWFFQGGNGPVFSPPQTETAGAR